MRARGMGPGAQTRRINHKMQGQVSKALREDKARKAKITWSQPDVVNLEDIQIPPEFDHTPITRLWYLSHCGPDGHFQTHNDTDALRYPEGIMPQAPLMRRLKIARRLIPVALPEFAKLLYETAGWRIILQIGAEALMGFVPAFGTWTQAKLVDAVQRSLYSNDVASNEVIRLALWSIIASNAQPLVNILLSKNSEFCKKSIGRKTDRINLQLHLDLDIPSSSNPIVEVLLQDCGTFISSSGGSGGSGLSHVDALVYSFFIFANLFSSIVLCLSTLRAMLEFGFASPISTATFVLLATFPTIFSDLIRRSGVFTPQPDFMAWQNAEHQSRTFYQIGTSFAYKQEVLLFGLRDWVIKSWESAKIASDRHDHARGNMLFQTVTVSSLPQNIVKDLLYLCIGLRIFSEKITLGSVHVVQSTAGTLYWQISGFSSQINSVIYTIYCIAGFMCAQAWIKEQREGGIRTETYEPKVPGPAEKRGMKIEARGLSFRYPTGKANTLENVNLTIEAGETLAIVGFNGGGKTTLAKVLTGLYDYEGSLLIDGIEAKTYKRESLYKYMTVCPQNIVAFPLTIRENIGLGKVGDMDDTDSIMRAVRRGGAEEVIKTHGLNKILAQAGVPTHMAWGPVAAGRAREEEDLPISKDAKAESTKEGETSKTDEKGKDENNEKSDQNEVPAEGKVPEEKGNVEDVPVSPSEENTEKSTLLNGVKEDSKKNEAEGVSLGGLPPPSIALSGGQMQRVAISRAFMRADDATLVVLDEPSASLDARAEYELFQRIHALSKGDSEDTRTTIYISHRFSTVRRADKIAVVEDGTITELGSHKELMELNGRYAEFFNLQVKAFSEG